MQVKTDAEEEQKEQRAPLTHVPALGGLPRRPLALPLTLTLTPLFAPLLALGGAGLLVPL